MLLHSAHKFTIIYHIYDPKITRNKISSSIDHKEYSLRLEKASNMGTTTPSAAVGCIRN